MSGKKKSKQPNQGAKKSQKVTNTDADASEAAASDLSHDMIAFGEEDSAIENEPVSEVLALDVKESQAVLTDTMSDKSRERGEPVVDVSHSLGSETVLVKLASDDTATKSAETQKTGSPNLSVSGEDPSSMYSVQEGGSPVSNDVEWVTTHMKETGVSLLESSNATVSVFVECEKISPQASKTIEEIDPLDEYLHAERVVEYDDSSPTLPAKPVDKVGATGNQGRSASATGNQRENKYPRRISNETANNNNLDEEAGFFAVPLVAGSGDNESRRESEFMKAGENMSKWPLVVSYALSCWGDRSQNLKFLFP